MAYEFHYTPTGTGVISGKEVLEQTEDAINDLGNTAISGVQEALDKAEQALTNSENAVDDAQTALNTANNAEGVAIQAQTDVGNLSGTVTNIGNRVTTAEGNITNLQGRMTTAEGNITNIQGRMTTAEGNIGNLQTAVSTAQATANSAQQTATTARQQSYVFRYSSTALTASSTNSNTLLDNTDNLKVGDKVIDSSGVLFSITAIDTQNSTFTIGTALIDLAQDSDVVHKSGDETIGGEKTFSSDITLQGTTTPVIKTISNIIQDSTGGNESISWVIRDKTDSNTVFAQSVNKFSGQSVDWRLDITSILNGTSFTRGTRLVVDPVNENYRFTSSGNNTIDLGSSTNRWKSVYAMNYYYGSNNVEFSTKFVTTDTNQTISGNKTFSNGTLIVNNGIGDNVHGEIKFSGSRSGYIVADNASDGVFDNANCGISILLQDAGKPLHIGGYKVDSNGRVFADNTNKTPVLSITSNLIKTATLVPENDTSNNLFRILSQLDYANGNPSKTLDVRFIQYDNADASSAIYSNDDGKTSLGVATRRWSDVRTYKVNGVEPSSLSLPSGNVSDVIDISSYITALDGTSNSYTVPANGWISITITGTAIAIVSSSWSDSRLRESSGNVRMLYPVLKNETLDISVIGTTLAYARFIPCQGNI